MFRRFILPLSLILLPVTAFAKGGVVSSADPRASAAGQEILREGGSAADAAMAMMLALTVVEPQSSGIGGGGFLIHHDGTTGRIETIDGRETAPASATPGLFLNAAGKPVPFGQAFPGGRSVGVPGNIRLMALTHGKWGKLPWEKLFEPAIRLAEQGFTVGAPLNAALNRLESLWADFPAARAIYHVDGKPARVGATLKNPALGSLLRKIAKEGPDAFYTGDAAQAIVDAVAGASRNPTQLTLADLKAYQAKERPAVCVRYRRYKLCGMGPPSSGAATVFQIVGQLERFDMARLGKDSPVAWHLIAESMMLAYADRDAYLGDGDFVSVPMAGLLDPAYVARRSRLIAPNRSLDRYEAGTPPGAERRTAAASSEVPSTTHFVAVDGKGDVVTMTSTIEGPFGSQLIANGMALNNELTDFSLAPEKNGAPVANRVEPGKRPLSSMSPTIVYDEKGRVVLALGSAGGKRIIMHVAKTLIGVLDWGLPASQAIALPNLYFDGDTVLVEAGTRLDAMRGEIAKLGRPVEPADLGSKLNAVQRVGAGWQGAADPRSVGVALNE